jgi:gliding motility-associated protein GldC
MSKKRKDISINVELDDEHIPSDIIWDTSDNPAEKPTSCRAMLLSLWDHNRKDTLRLDLWTRDMTVDEMKIFFHQTMLTMADTLQQATKEEEMAEDMRDFCAYFADKMQIKAE